MRSVTTLFCVINCLCLVQSAAALAATSESRGARAQAEAPSAAVVPADPLATAPVGGSLQRELQPAAEAVPSETDRARSLALFAEARLLFQREEYPAALRAYQRAYHWNPAAHAPLKEIVPLAFHLQDMATGTRYAVLAAEKDPSNTELVEPVVAYLNDEQQFERAYRLKHRALAARSETPRDADWVRQHYDLGRLAFLAGLFPEAGEAFAVVDDAWQNPDKFQLDQATQKVLARNEQVFASLLGESFLQSKRLDRAEHWFAEAQQIAPDEPLHIYRQAQLSAARDKPQQALAALQKYLDAGGNKVGTEPYQLLEKVLTQLGRVDDPARGLIALLRQAHQRHPQHALLAFALADALRARGQQDAALPLYELSLAQATTVEAYTGAFACCLSVQDAGKFCRLLGAYVDNGGDWSSLGEIGSALVADQAFRDESWKYLDTLAASEATGQAETEETPPAPVASALFGGGQYALAADQPERAARYFSAAVAVPANKHPEWTISAALEFFMADEMPLAIQWLGRAAQEAPKDQQPDIALYLTTALELDGQTEQALEVIEKALEQVPDSVVLKSRKGWVLAHAERLPQAESWYTSLIAQYDEQRQDPLVREALREVRSGLSNIKLLQDDLTAAAEWLEQILDEFPEDVGAMNDLGYLWADANRHLYRSLRMVRHAVEQEPQNYAYLDSLGWTLFRLGRFEEAVRYLSQAAELSAGDGIICEHLGDVYAQIDQPDKAHAAWQRAQEAFRKTEDDEKLKALQSKLENP